MACPVLVNVRSTLLAFPECERRIRVAAENARIHQVFVQNIDCGRYTCLAQAYGGEVVGDFHRRG